MNNPISTSIVLFPCEICGRTLKSKSGQTNHQKKCKFKSIDVVKSSDDPEMNSTDPSDSQKTSYLDSSTAAANQENLTYDEVENFFWGEKKGSDFKLDLNIAYEQIVYWRQNLFLLPTGNVGKRFIREITRLINCWIDDSPLKHVAFKAIMVMPALLLQKPSQSSKAKDHLAALTRRFLLWEQGNIKELLHEGETIQNLLSSSKKKSLSTTDISKRFISKMSKGNINGAIKLLAQNMEKGILPLDDKTLKLLKQKHPDGTNSLDHVLLDDIPTKLHSVRFDEIDSEHIRLSALKTRGGAGPSGLDGDGWRRILTSNSFGNEPSELCSSIAKLTRSLCSIVQEDNSLEPLLASRLIPLNKNPGLRPIGIGETLRRVIGKTVAKVLKKDVVESVGSLQVCAGQDAGCEAAIHSLRRIFEEEDSEAVMLIDASNAFNSINRKAFLHNIKIVCPSLATFTTNCYSSPSRLFVIGGTEIASSEGTTQGDPIAGFVYAIAIIPLILRTVSELKEKGLNTKAAGYADDLFGGGKLLGLKLMWDYIVKWGPDFGYHQQADKTWIIVKPQHLKEAERIFKDTKIKITSDGRKHLGASIGSLSNRSQYINEKIDDWIREITLLSEIALFAPQEAYTCFTAGYKHKLSYYMRTIPNIGDALKRFDEVVSSKLIPAVTGGIQPNSTERLLFSLPPSQGGLGIPIFSKLAEREFENSNTLTKQLQKNILNQEPKNIIDNEAIKKIKSKIMLDKKILNQKILNEIRLSVSDEKNKLIDICCEKGASLWLTTLPIKDEGFQVNKQSFWDLIRIRYGYQLTRLPSTCVCGSTFDLDHALSCKKGGFVTLRHNSLRDLTAKMLDEVCKDVRVEPILNVLTGETLSEPTANRGDEARLDISARNVWVTGQKAFFDIRVFNPLARKYSNTSISKAYESNEKEKKRKYNQRVLEVEQGSFTPLVFNAMGGMGREAQAFYKRLAQQIADKKKSDYQTTATCIRRKISFALMNSVIMCLRGSRAPWRSSLDLDTKTSDCEILCSF